MRGTGRAGAPRRSRLGRVARAAAWGVGGVLALVLLALAGGAGWIAWRLRARRAQAERAAAEAVRRAEAEGRVYRGTRAGRRVALLVRDCAVYDLTRGGATRPARVVATDPYPWPTVCERQSLDTVGGWVTVTLGRTAFGAGGCCVSGGSWRTRDGRTWERRWAGAWLPVDSVDALRRAPAADDTGTVAADDSAAGDGDHR